jgi:hypothetical protein
MKLFRMACCDLVDPDPLGHELYKVRHHVLPTQDALDTSPNRVGFFVRMSVGALKGAISERF